MDNWKLPNYKVNYVTHSVTWICGIRIAAICIVYSETQMLADSCDVRQNKWTISLTMSTKNYWNQTNSIRSRRWENVLANCSIKCEHLFPVVIRHTYAHTRTTDSHLLRLSANESVWIAVWVCYRRRRCCCCRRHRHHRHLFMEYFLYVVFNSMCVSMCLRIHTIWMTHILVSTIVRLNAINLLRMFICSHRFVHFVHLFVDLLVFFSCFFFIRNTGRTTRSAWKDQIENV